MRNERTIKGDQERLRRWSSYREPHREGASGSLGTNLSFALTFQSDIVLPSAHKPCMSRDAVTSCDYHCHLLIKLWLTVITWWGNILIFDVCRSSTSKFDSLSALCKTQETPPDGENQVHLPTKTIRQSECTEPNTAGFPAQPD